MRRIDISNKREWWKDAIPFFILIILSFIFFSDTLFGDKIFIHRDLSRFFYPLREFSVTQFLTGHVPLWNPYIHCGSAHLAELQTCVFYPFSIIYLLFSYPQAFNYFIILHIFLAGLFTYLLMREWKYSRYASFFSATVFMFSGYIISVINLLASLASVVWLPLAILFYERSLNGGRVKNYIFTGIFLTLMFLGGEPIVLYSAIFILLLLGGASERVHATVASRIAPIAISLLILIGLSCFQILPFLEFVKYSSRSSMDFAEASMWSLPPYALLDLFIPYLSELDYVYKDYWTRQSWLMVYYMGIFTLICAVLSLKFDVTKRRRCIFYILALGLVLSFGRYTPIYYILYKIMPGFTLSRYPVKFFFMVAFSLAILGGMGLEYYRNNIGFAIEIRKFLKIILITAFIFSFFYLVINLNFSAVSNLLYKGALKITPSFADKEYKLGQLLYAGIYNIKRGLGIFMFLSILMFLPLKKKIKLNAVIPILIFISFLDIFTANKILYQNMNIDEYLEAGESIKFLKEDNTLYRIFNSPTTLRENTFVPERDYFEGMKSLKERMASNRGVSFKIYDAYGYGSLYNKRHEEVMILIIRSDLPDETNLLNLLNVKYVISTKDFKARGYRLVKRGDKVNIYANRNVLPRAFLVEKTVLIKDEKEILERLKSKDFNPSKEVILEEDFSLTNYKPPTLLSQAFGKGATRNETVNILEYKPNEVVIEAIVNTQKFLILSDSFYPGWKVYVDGKQEKIYRADYILRAVYLDPGRHIIRFTYDPFSFKIGSIITVATILILVYILWKRRL